MAGESFPDVGHCSFDELLMQPARRVRCNPTNVGRDGSAAQLRLVKLEQHVERTETRGCSDRDVLQEAATEVGREKQVVEGSLQVASDLRTDALCIIVHCLVVQRIMEVGPAMVQEEGTRV